MQHSFRYLGLKQLPKNYRDVLGRWDDPSKLRHIIVQVLMIYTIYDQFVHQSGKFLEIDNIPSCRIGHAGYSNFDRVIVTVTARVIALIKDGLIPLIGVGRIEKAMGGRKMRFACNVNHGFDEPQDTLKSAIVTRSGYSTEISLTRASRWLSVSSSK
jgi:hypothetical protein